MKNFRIILLLIFSSISLQSIAQSDEEVQPTNMDKLLEVVREGRSKEKAENQKRESEFLSNRDRQQVILNEELAELARQEEIADRLDKIFKENQELLRVAEEVYLKALGSLNELFGHITSISTDSRVTFESSLTAAEFGKAREVFLDNLTRKMGESTELPTISELERVMSLITEEMVATGSVSKFKTNVINVDGSQSECEVVRVGVYNAVCGKRYLEYVPTKGQYQFLARQPAGRYTGSAGRISNSSLGGGYVSFAVDPSGPSGGALLANLIQNPSLWERIQQGGLIGYIILGLGSITMAFAIYKYYVLFMLNRSVVAQMGSSSYGNNPLGRVLKVGEAHMKDAIDRLELKLAEQIMAERPKIEQGISFVKIVSVVAPLAGLLGTVTGMIITFQQITLFGTGDPKIMAGGISQALVTTVLGLVVAIPTTLAHSFLQSSARSVVDVLEEQATGMVAEKAK